MGPFITILPPHEAVDIYEKVYPLRGVNLEKNVFEMAVTPTQKGDRVRVVSICGYLSVCGCVCV